MSRGPFWRNVSRNWPHRRARPHLSRQSPQRRHARQQLPLRPARPPWRRRPHPRLPQPLRPRSKSRSPLREGLFRSRARRRMWLSRRRPPRAPPRPWPPLRRKRRRLPPNHRQVRWSPGLPFPLLSLDRPLHQPRLSALSLPSWLCSPWLPRRRLRPSAPPLLRFLNPRLSLPRKLQPLLHPLRQPCRRRAESSCRRLVRDLCTVRRRPLPLLLRLRVEAFSAAVLFSIAALPLAPEARVPEWARLASSPADAGPCTPRVRSPAVPLDQGSVLAWVLALDSDSVPVSASVPGWADPASRRRLPVKLRARLVPVRVAAAVRITRRPKKAR